MRKMSSINLNNIQFLHKYGIMHKIPPPSFSEDGGLHNLYIFIYYSPIVT